MRRLPSIFALALVWACGQGLKTDPDGGTAPHCGDGHTDTGYEQCDDGVNNGPTGNCSTVCKFNVQ